MPQEQMDAYFAKMQDESYLAFLDMDFLNLPRPRRIPRIPTLALGGEQDAIISTREVRATAAAYGGEAEESLRAAGTTLCSIPAGRRLPTASSPGYAPYAACAEPGAARAQKSRAASSTEAARRL